MKRSILSLLLCLVPGALLQAGEEVKVNFLAKGVTAKVGGYRPIRAEMNEEASIVKKAPEDFAAAKYGYFVFGEKKIAFVLNEPEDGAHRLIVDGNGDGDLTNDKEVTWTQKGGTFNGDTEVDLGGGKLGKVNMYRFDPKDERRAQLKNTVLYYGDFGYEFEFKLDGKPFSTFVAGELASNIPLPIDRDGNGRVSQRFEMTVVGKPFNFTGTTYVWDLDKGNLVLNKSDEKLPEAPLPPDLRIGKEALKFTAKTMDGNEVEFPKSYAGKIVMLDFWATWCGPCIGEIPHMKEAYAEWHDKGFEILGVSFDFPGQDEKVVSFLKEKELPWPQILEGKGWDTSIGIQHDVSGIPFVLLVDGDSGKILATAAQLRGPKLTEVIGEQLEKKKASN